MEEKLIKQLIKSYREQGIDLYALLDDPLFVRLPLETKVKAIKKFAKDIAEGTSRGVTKSDVRAVIKDVTMAGIVGAAAGGGTAMAAASHFVGGPFNQGKLPYKAIGAGAIISGLSFAASTAMSAAKIHKDRNQILDKIYNVIDNPTDENAIDVLHTRNNQVAPNTSMAATSAAETLIKNKIGQIPQTIMGTLVPAHVKSRTFLNNRGMPVAHPHTPEHVAKLTEEAYEAAFNSNHFFK